MSNSNPSETKSTVKSKPKQALRKTIQELILETLSNKPMELGEIRKKNPKAQKCLESVCRQEFKNEKKDDKIVVYPTISEHGLEVIAKYCSGRGIAHYWLKDYSKEILAVGKKILKATELQTLEKVIAKEKEAQK